MWREANLWRGAILSPIPGEGGLQPIVCCQPARSSTGGFFLAVSPGGFSGCVARLFSGCVARLFSGCVARLFSGCVARLFSGCVARFVFWLCRQVVTDCVVRWFLAGLARVCFPDVRQCVIAKDRASLNFEQVN